MEYGLIGEKLSHSYSKQIHELLGDYSYEIKNIAPGDLPVAFADVGRDMRNLVTAFLT